MDVTLDFESRSECNLKKRGLFVYMEHPTTEPMCLSVMVDDEEPRFWVAPKFEPLIVPSQLNYKLIGPEQVVAAMRTADRLIAQNSMFEYLMWNWIMVRRFGWPERPLDKFYDTMTQLAYHALPMNLKDGGAALNLDILKDDVGHKVMMKLCKPRNPRKAEKEADPDWVNKTFWHEKPEDITTLCNYCCRDVEAERLVFNTLDLPPEHERETWLMDQRLNLRGASVDVPNVRAIVKTISEHEKNMLMKFSRATRGLVSGPRSYAALKKWVNGQTGYKVTSVDKESTEALLAKKDLPENVRAALEVKSELSKSSVAKFTAMLNRMNADGKVRGWSAYHAAATGRWAAWGLQLHNNPRDSYKPEEYELVMELFRTGNIEAIRLLWDNPYHVASRCVRGSLIAKEGTELFCTDFSAIEGRGLAYLAGEQWVLDAYAKGEDMYKHAAAELFGVSYDEVTKAQRQVGKVMELFLGYAGGIGAFASGAKAYNINLELLPELILPHATEEELGGRYGAEALSAMYIKKNPGSMSLEAAIACDVIKRKWRAKRPRIVSFWKMCERAAIAAIMEPGKVFSCGRLRYAVSRGFLKCQLPSGRVLHYYKPQVSMKETDWGEAETITFMGMKIVEGKTTRQWTRLHTFGGKLVENVTQAHCRDLLADAMLRHEKAGFDIVLHVHDEDAAEVPIGEREFEEFNRLAEIVPAYAQGMPIKAEGWVGKRYRK